MLHGRRLAGVATLSLTILTAAAPVGAGAPGVAGLQVHVGGHGPQWGHYGDDEAPVATERGSWTVESRLDGDQLRLQVRLTPAEVNPVLGAGRASLVTGVGVEYGLRTSGDVGYGERLGFTWTPLDPCTGDPCSYTTEMTVPLRPAQRFIVATEGIESPVVVIGFGLVRTFGQGAWLQVIRAEDDEDGRRSRTARSLPPKDGWLPQAPVIPAGDAQLWGLGSAPNVGITELTDLLGAAADASAPVPTVTAQVDLSADGCLPHTGVQLVDAWSTLPLSGSVATVGSTGTLVAIPDGTDWSLMVGTLRIGQVSAAGEDVVVTATVACRYDPGDDADIVGGGIALSAPSDPLPAPPAPVPWLVAVESTRSDRPLNPALPVALPDGFAVVERTHDDGWTVSRSEDGLRWRALDGARLPAAVRADAVDGLAIVAADGRALLGGIIPDGDGGDRFAAWSSTDLRRWAAAEVVKPSGRPAATSLVLRSLVASDRRWFALADGDGAASGFAWASTDGRSWTAIVPDTPAATTLVAVSAGPSRLLGIARPHDPGRPDLLVTSPDGRRWTELGTLPISGSATVSIGESSAGTIVAGMQRSSVAPVEVWTSADEGASWQWTLEAPADVRLERVTVEAGTVVVAGSVRYRARGLSATPWAAVSRDSGRTWRVETPVNGFGEGRCITVAAIGTDAAVLTASECSGSPAPRWRAALPPDVPSVSSD